MWYVIQTITGKEEELISMIDALLPQELYEACFLIRAQWMKRLGGIWQNQVRPLFPGYVFMDTVQPEDVFFKLKGVPRLAKILGSGRFDFVAVEAKEEEFLKLISGAENKSFGESASGRKPEFLVRLTKVETREDGTISEMNGILNYFQNDIEKINLHKRYAIVKTELFQREQTLLFGLRLKQDEVRE